MKCKLCDGKMLYSGIVEDGKIYKKLFTCERCEFEQTGGDNTLTEKILGIAVLIIFITLCIIGGVLL